MTAAATLAAARRGEAGPATAFDRVLVGVDGSAASLEAARQAAVLVALAGTLRVVTVFGAAPAVGGTGTEIPPYLDEERQRRVAERIAHGAAAALAELHAVDVDVAGGCPWEELLRLARRRRATLVVVGSSGVGRARGVVCGSTTTEVLHRAPSAVLVARAAGSEFPGRIVVGLDASPEAALAHAEALRLARRFGAEVRTVSARDPVDGLVSEARGADLLVVGSRGLHGVRALGSVSERVAHRAPCSVLVVRPARNAPPGG
jgi:nucleotide-binding universal stress UspA family protein